MYKINYTHTEYGLTQMGQFEVSNFSFNQKEFFSIVDSHGEPALSVLHLKGVPEIYGNSVYLKVDKVDFPSNRCEIDFNNHYYGDQNYETVRRYEDVFDRLLAFRYEDKDV